MKTCLIIFCLLVISAWAFNLRPKLVFQQRLNRTPLHRHPTFQPMNLECSATNSFLHARTDVVLSNFNENSWWNAVLPKVKETLKVFFMIVAPMLLVSLFGVHPILAATLTTSKKPTGKSVDDLRSIVQAGTLSGGKSSFLRKLFLGVNARGAMRSGRIGDTRTEGAMLINGLSMCLIFGVWGLYGYVQARRIEIKEMKNMQKEILREKEYRENMYFDAVESILKKLEDPNLKNTMKANLANQLKDLDPDGKIRTFIKNGAKADQRPDLSDALRIGEKKRIANRAAPSKKTPENKSGDKNTTNKTNKPTSPSLQGVRTSTNSKSEDEVDDKNNDDDEAENKIESSGTNSNTMYKVLMELDSSLTGVMSTLDRNRLIAYLKRRIESVEDRKKKEAVIAKLAEKLGDAEYWTKYLEGIP